MKNCQICLFVSIFFLLFGCSTFSTYNVHAEKLKSSTFRLPEYDFPVNKRKDRTLVMLALSGGGSRAAYFSISVMEKLSNLGILKNVDIISSISGGSIAGAYYCISGDEGSTFASGRYWDFRDAKNNIKKNFIYRFIGNLFWPDNIFLYWFTGFTRTDIMSQTLADNLFDTNYSGRDLKFKEFNSERPMLLINATNATQGSFGEPFVFTKREFERYESDLGEFLISKAVMASAGFPGVFQYSALKDFSAKIGNKYIHLYDGGIYDNLGIKTLSKIINKNINNYDNFVIISVDAYNGYFAGIPSDDYGTKGYIFDSTIQDSFDSILKSKRQETLDEMKKNVIDFPIKFPAKKLNFIHFAFENILKIVISSGNAKKEGKVAPYIKLFKDINKIPTTLSISDNDAKLIDESVEIMFSNINGNEENIMKLNELHKSLNTNEPQK